MDDLYHVCCMILDVAIWVRRSMHSLSGGHSSYPCQCLPIKLLHRWSCKRAISQNRTKMMSKSALILSLFGLLSPQLHHQVHKPVYTEDEHGNQPRVHPAIVLVVQIQRA